MVVNNRAKGSDFSYITPVGSAISEPFELSVPMYTARNMEGEIRLWFDQNNLSVEETRLMAAFGNQGALAIERIHLMESDNIARVLKESDRIKTSLLNSVSHELRSPLAAIKASASSLRSGTVVWDSSARAELLATVERETDQLNLLVGNLLDMSRIEAGALEPKVQWNSLGSHQECGTKMRGQLVNHRVQYQFEKDLPLLPTDFVMMGQVFTNLFSNSIKYAPIDTPILVFSQTS